MLSQEELRSILYKSIEKNDIEGVRSALDQGAVVNDLSVLEKELIDTTAKFRNEFFDLSDQEFSNFAATLNSTIDIDNDNVENYKRKVTQIDERYGIKPNCFKLARELVRNSIAQRKHQKLIDNIREEGRTDNNGQLVFTHDEEQSLKKLNDDKRFYNIITYTDLTNEKVVGLELSITMLNGKLCSKDLYYNALYKVLKSIDVVGCNIAKIANLAKLIINHDNNSIVSSQVYQKSMGTGTDNVALVPPRCLSTAYQVAELVLKMLKHDDQGKEEVAALIEQVVQCGIKPDEIEKNINIVHDEWQENIADSSIDFTKAQLSVLKNRALKYVQKCIPETQLTEPQLQIQIETQSIT